MNGSSRLIFKPNAQMLLMFQRRKISKKPLCDMIGPADPISNLHHINYAVQENETANERKLRIYREKLQAWNELFWTKHNLNFIQKKKEFCESELKKKSGSESLTADDISVFYKDFLDKNWKTLLNYLCEWYKKNAYVTLLHFRVEIEKIFKKVDHKEEKQD